MEALLGLIAAAITAGGLYLTQRMAAKSNRLQAERAAAPDLVEALGTRVDTLYQQVDQLRRELEEERARGMTSRHGLRIAGQYIDQLGRWLWRISVGPPPQLFTERPPMPPRDLGELIDPTPWKSLTPED